MTKQNNNARTQHRKLKLRKCYVFSISVDIYEDYSKHYSPFFTYDKKCKNN